MQCLLYRVVCFKVRNTTKDVFVAHVVDVAFANCGVFMGQHTHDAKVSLIQHKVANGIPSPSDNDINSP
jgi:predicted metal-binding protein